MDESRRLTAALAERYEIQREIGRGGMATVYLARDLRHDRLVALKLLDPELGAILGVERFLAEIRLTAKLQHPNLLPLFDSGEADGLLFYVMPFVDGESLRARLHREHQLPISEAVRLATGVASALEYAHRAGVVHRDLKPENILLNDGQPLLADFGIALAVSKAGGARITQTGLSLGTPQYMSPEQATGDRAIDGRTDIYSLGAVTYEMLTGEPPHTASTAQGIIAKLMVEEVRPLNVLRRAVPVYVDLAVRRALEKLPADRFGSAREFSDALNGKGAEITLGTPRLRARAGWLVPALATLALILGIFGADAWLKLSKIGSPAPIQFKLEFPEGQELISNPGAPIAVSSDGRAVVYSATGAEMPALYLRRLDELQTRVIGRINPPSDLKLSPDGRWISFVGGPNEIDRVSVDGGPIEVIAQANELQGTSWAENGAFVFADGSTLWSVDAGATTPRKMFSVPAPYQRVALPFILPGGRDVMFAVTPAGALRPRLAIASLDGSKQVVLDTHFGNVLGYQDGWLIYGRIDGSVVARRFDARRRTFHGNDVALLNGVAWKDLGGLEASLSSNGTLAYVRGDANASLTLLDWRGVSSTLTSVRGAHSSAAWSPDGSKIAVDLLNDGIWIYDVASRALSRLTPPGLNASRPAWTADGTRVAFADADSSIWWAPADQSAPAEPFYVDPHLSVREVAFSPDGRYAVLRTSNTVPPTRADLYLLPLAGSERRAVPFLKTTAQEEMPSVSPDSRWLAYESDETGRFEIYVRALPGGGGRVQVSADGGTSPRWTPDGKRLVYRAARSFWAASIDTRNVTPRVTSRDSLFADKYLRSDADHQTYDIARDGRFSLFMASGKVDIVVVANWWSAARAKLPR